jgi:hypothetical protein
VSDLEEADIQEVLNSFATLLSEKVLEELTEL